VRGSNPTAPRALASLLPTWLAVMTLAGPGCGDQPHSCVLATEGCDCTPIGLCDPGLICAASKQCVRPTAGDGGTAVGTDGAPGMSTAVMAPPAPPPLPGASGNATSRDAGIGLVSDGAAGDAPGGGAAGSGPRWTVFVYGHADHNLSPTMLADLAEMSRARLTDDVRVLALIDWNGKTKLPGNASETFPAGTFLYRPIGGGQRQLVGTAEELDFDDPTVLADAVALAFTRYPADRYGLVLWDHGGSFRGGYGGDQQNGTRAGNPMNVGAVASAVRAGLDAAGLKGTRPLEFLALDACLMSGVEVTSAFAELTKVYIGNAELDYGPGLDYEGTLSWLAANPGASPADFARAEAMTWDAHHREASRVDGFYRSHAAWDMSRWGDFLAASRTLATAIRSNDAAAAAARAMFFSLPSYYKARNANGLDLRDAADVLSGLSGATVAPVAAAARDTLAAARAARITGSNGRFREQQIGLHLFGGLLATLPAASVQAYPQLARDWSQATGWGDLLAYLTGAVPAGKPQFTSTESLPAGASLRDPPRVDFQTTSPDIAYAEALVMAQDADDPLVYVNHGTIGHGIIAPGQHKVVWPGQVLAVAANPSDVRVSVNPWSFTAERGMTGSQFRVVNGSLRDTGGQEVAVGLLLDQNDEASEFVVHDATGGFNVLSLRALTQAEQKITFIPTLDIFDGHNEQFTTRRGTVGLVVPASGKLAFRPLAVGAGSYMVGVFVVDVWGKADGEFHTIRLEGPLPP
jgi:hypothetical protein